MKRTNQLLFLALTIGLFGFVAVSGILRSKIWTRSVETRGHHYEIGPEEKPIIVGSYQFVTVSKVDFWESDFYRDM